MKNILKIKINNNLIQQTIKIILFIGILLCSAILEDNISVLCRKSAGELNNLELIYENLEDFDNNETDFIFFSL